MDIFWSLWSLSLPVTAMLNFSRKANTSIHGLGEIDTARSDLADYITNTFVYNICTMLDKRRGRWSDIVQMIYKCFVFAWPSCNQIIVHFSGLYRKYYLFKFTCHVKIIFIYPVVCHRQNLDNPYMCYGFKTPLLPPRPWPIHS